MEKKLTSKVSDLKSIITKPKSAKYSIDGVEVKVILAGDTLIFEYPSKEAMITYNLIQASDALKKKSTQMGLRSGKDMKFIIDL
jgi:hypothetical protein